MITTVEPFLHASLEGVKVYPMDETPQQGKEQTVLVRVAPNVEIPLHTHQGDATMFIVSGSGHVLSDGENNGASVEVGDCVFFEKLRQHGFQAGDDGLTFISMNEGIVDRDPNKWDIDFAYPA